MRAAGSVPAHSHTRTAQARLRTPLQRGGTGPAGRMRMLTAQPPGRLSRDLGTPSSSLSINMYLNTPSSSLCIQIHIDTEYHRAARMSAAKGRSIIDNTWAPRVNLPEL